MNVVFFSRNTFNHRELKTPWVTTAHLVKCAWRYKKVWVFLVCMVFLCSYKEASTHVQAASDSDKDLTWYLISANVLTNTSASMLSDMVGAISDSGVGTTLSKLMLQFCIKHRKNLCYSGRPTQTKEKCDVNRLLLWLQQILINGYVKM